MSRDLLEGTWHQVPDEEMFKKLLRLGRQYPLAPQIAGPLCDVSIGAYIAPGWYLLLEYDRLMSGVPQVVFEVLSAQQVVTEAGDDLKALSLFLSQAETFATRPRADHSQG